MALPMISPIARKWLAVAFWQIPTLRIISPRHRGASRFTVG